MKVFLDTASLEEIKEAVDMNILDGVTTNPSLIAKQGVVGLENQFKHYVKICELVGDADVSAEVVSEKYEDMIEEGMKLHSLHTNIVIKLPCTVDGLKAVKYFSERNIKTNCTLIFSLPQAILAAKAGATYVSPFVGRLDDVGADGCEVVNDILVCFEAYGYRSKVLAASIRNVAHINKALDYNFDIVTCPISVIREMINHKLTAAGLEKFKEDYKSVK